MIPLVNCGRIMKKLVRFVWSRMFYGGNHLKKLVQLMLHRTTLVGFAMLVQAVLLIVVPYCFPKYAGYFHTFCIIISGIAVLHLINNRINPAYKIAWIVPILLFPIFGGVFYGLLGGNKLSKRTRRKLQRIQRKMDQALPPSEQTGDLLCHMAGHNLSAANQSTYITEYAICPPYENTNTEYLPIGEIKFERLKEELRKAKHYIFLEYFIIEPGIMWDSILEILQYKVKNGVEVRVIYDDIGCIRTLPHKYHHQLEAMGIKCCVFNPFRPILSGRFNNRDHRKIAVIDGKVGFTGGINLADEYINARERFGHWKDTAVVLEGRGVWNLAVMFLSMWGYLRGVEENFDDFRPYFPPEELPVTKGYVQPFNDSPWDQESVGENVYLNMITRANRYVYITTPYLVIDHEMLTALSNAAKSGVDIRIITLISLISGMCMKLAVLTIPCFWKTACEFMNIPRDLSMPKPSAATTNSESSAPLTSITAACIYTWSAACGCMVPTASPTSNTILSAPCGKARKLHWRTAVVFPGIAACCAHSFELLPH